MSAAHRLSRISLRATLRLATRARLGGRAHGTVLVLGHMRAGTSLLAHLLCSHDEISGWGERNRPLADSADLTRLAADIAWRARDPRLVLPPPIGPRWLLDVINHDALLPRPSILERPDLRLIFILREPEGCLASMSAYLGGHYGWTPQRAAHAYITRLGTLGRLAESLSAAACARSRAIHFSQLIDNPTAALGPTAELLGLAEPPGDRYATQPWTGRFGDRSPSIHAGRVLKDKQRHGAVGPIVGPIVRQINPEIDPGTARRAREAHARCRNALARLQGTPRREA